MELREEWAQYEHAMIGIAVVLAQKCARLAEGVRAAEAKYPFPLLCDEDRAVIKAYGVWHPIGLDAFDSAHPAAFLIDARRKLRYSFVGRTQFARAPLAKILAAAAELPDVR